MSDDERPPATFRARHLLVALLFGLAFGEPIGRFVRDEWAALMTATVAAPIPTPVPVGSSGLSWGPSAPGVYGSSGTLTITSCAAETTAVVVSCSGVPAYSNGGATGPVTLDLGDALVGTERLFFVASPHRVTVLAPPGGLIYVEGGGYRGWTSRSPGASLTIFCVGSSTWAARRNGFTGTWESRDE